MNIHTHIHRLKVTKIDFLAIIYRDMGDKHLSSEI
jgi:hypothetical protein